MLIIAQPKSASTSLASTLSRHLKLPWHQLEFARNNVGRPASFGPSASKRKRIYTALPHSDIIEYTQRELDEMAKHRDIFKQHIPPTKEALEAITTKGFKCIILLRRPEDSVQAYRHATKRKAKLMNNKDDAKDKLKQMQEFHDGYAQLKGWKNVKIVYFEDLVLNEEKVLNDILKFLGRPKMPNSRAILDKKRFTGKGLQNLIERKAKEEKQAAELEKKRLEALAAREAKEKLLEEQKKARLEEALAASQEKEPEKTGWQKFWSSFKFWK